MSLTGPTLIVALVILTAAAFGLAVAALPRMAANRVLPVLARSGTLAGVVVLVLLTSAAAMNDHYGFYADWQDLANGLSGGVPASGSHGGGTGRAAADVALPAAAVASAVPQPITLPPGHRTLSVTVTGPRSGLTGTIVVSVPPGYAGDTVRRYPVIETYSGYPGRVTTWLTYMRLPEVLDTEAGKHAVADAVVVSPQLEFPEGADTECVDGGAKGPAVEAWLTEDVPQWVLDHLDVRADRGSWSTIGLSAGGWCAAMSTMLHPARYAGAIVMGGYFEPMFEPGYRPFTAGSPAARRYDLVHLVGTAAPPVAMWVQTSHADPVSYPTSSALLKAARAPLSVDATVLADAGHRAEVWKDALPTAVAWLGRTLPGFSPSTTPPIGLVPPPSRPPARLAPRGRPTPATPRSSSRPGTTPARAAAPGAVGSP